MYLHLVWLCVGFAFGMVVFGVCIWYGCVCAGVFAVVAMEHDADNSTHIQQMIDVCLFVCGVCCGYVMCL